MKKLARTSVIVLAVALAACGSGEPARDTAQSTSASDAQGSPQGMQGMEGTQGMQSGGTMEQMQAHMGMIRGVSGDRMKAMLPEHRQMAANMVSEFNREMKGMNMMSTNAAWNATVDSLRQDLVRMPEMGADELTAFMPAHEARLTRLMEMHRAMMAEMRM